MVDHDLVGRDRELAVLDAAIAGLADERPALVVVFGEAGAGKTSLARAALANAAGRGVATSVGACVDGENTLAFSPIRAAFAGLVAAVGEDPARDALDDHPAVAHLFPSAVRPRGAGTAGDDVAELHQDALDLLGELAEQQPLLLVIEDVHWIDRSSLTLVSALARNLSGERIAIVLTVRTEDVDPDGPTGRQVEELCRLRTATRIDLEGLDPEAIGRLLGRAHDGRPISRAEVESLWRRTRGNPFFALELAASDVSTGAPLPDSIRSLLALRLRGLSEPAERVVRTAAVIGAEVEPEMIARVMGRPIVAVEGALREAVSAGAVVIDPASGRVGFRHPLIREVALEGLLASERRRLSGSVADVLADDPEVDPARLARHLETAGRTAEALVAWVTAARSLVTRYGSEDAAELYAHAMTLWPDVPDADERVGASGTAVLSEAVQCCLDAGLFELGVELGTRLVEQIDVEREPERWARAATTLSELRWETGDAAGASALLDRATEALAGRERTAAWARVLERRAFHGAVAGSSVPLESLAHEVVSIAEELGDAELRVLGLNRLGLQRAAVGDPRGQDDLEAAFEAALEARLPRELVRATMNRLVVLHATGRLGIGRAAGDRARWAANELGIAGAARAVIDALYARIVFAQGDWATATEVLAEVTEPTGDRFTSYVAMARAELALGRGDVEAVHRALDTIAFSGVALTNVHAAAVSARLALLEGRPDMVEGIVQQRLAVAEVLPETTLLRMIALSLDALALLGDDDGTRADDLLERARSKAARLRSHPGRAPEDLAAAEAEVIACHAEATGGPAADAWQRAVEERRALGWPVQIAAAELRWARALVESGGDRHLAGRLAAAVHETATRVGADPLRGEVEDLVRRARLDVPAAYRGDDGDLGLTDREVEVLRLVAVGRSNRQIADALYISPKTASVHVSNILRKVGAANRGEAAAIAHRHGLLVGAEDRPT